MVRHLLHIPVRHKRDVVKEFQKGFLCVHAFVGCVRVRSKKDFVDRTILKLMVLPQPLKYWDWTCATTPNSNKWTFLLRILEGFAVVFEIKPLYVARLASNL